LLTLLAWYKMRNGMCITVTHFIPVQYIWLYTDVGWNA